MTKGSELSYKLAFERDMLSYISYYYGEASIEDLENLEKIKYENQKIWEN